MSILTSHSLMLTIRPSGRPAVTTVNVVFVNVHVSRCLSKRMDHWTSGTVYECSEIAGSPQCNNCSS